MPEEERKARAPVHRIKNVICEPCRHLNHFRLRDLFPLPHFFILKACDAPPLLYLVTVVSVAMLNTRRDLGGTLESSTLGALGEDFSRFVRHRERDSLKNSFKIFIGRYPSYCSLHMGMAGLLALSMPF